MNEKTTLEFLDWLCERLTLSLSQEEKQAITDAYLLYKVRLMIDNLDKGLK